MICLLLYFGISVIDYTEDYNGTDKCVFIMCKNVCFRHLFNTSNIKITKVMNSDIYCSKEVKSRLVLPLYIEYNNIHYRITEIGSESFENTNLTHITFLGNISNVESGAFQNNYNLEYLDISKFVITNIPERCFMNTPNLKNIKLPHTITSIQNRSFANTGIKKFNVKNPNFTIETAVFEGSTLLKFVNISALNITKIPDRLFNGCTSLKILILPNNITHVGEYALSGTKISDFDLTHINSLQIGVFSNCLAILSIDLSKSTITTINESMFYGCTNMKKIKFPSKLTTILKYAFSKTSLTKVVLPKTVTYIGEGVFADAQSLVTADFSKVSLRKIPDFTFQNCEKLTQFSISNTVTNIGIKAFEFSGIINVDLENTSILEIDDYAFSNCKQLKNIKFPNTLKKLGNGTFMDSSFDSSLLIENVSLTEISSYCFYNTPISHIILPNTVDTIRDYAFANTLLTNFDASIFIKYIGQGVFANCRKLEYVDLSKSNIQTIYFRTFFNSSILHMIFPKKLIEIESQAFCFTPMPELVFPRLLRKIGNAAFAHCENLTTVSMEYASVSIIDDYAFYNCSVLQKVEFSSKLSKIGVKSFSETYLDAFWPNYLDSTSYGSFMNISNLQKVDLSATTIKSINNSCFKDCVNLEYVKFPQTLTLIDKSCFENTGLQFVVLPQNLTKIKSSAFANIPKLRSANCGFAKLKTFPKKLFYKCENLTNIMFPLNLTTLRENSLSFTGFNSLTFPDSLEIIKTALVDMRNLTELNLNSTQVYLLEPRCFMNCASLKIVHLPMYLEEIGAYVFEGTQVLNIQIPYGCKLMPFAFANSPLHFVDLEESNITELLPNVFANTTNLTYVVLPVVLEIIKDYAFNNSGIVVFNFKSLKSIESFAFNCPDLETVDLKNTKLTYIPPSLFSKCPKLQKIELPESLEKIGPSAFQGTKIVSLKLPSSLTDVEEEGFMNCIFLESLDMSETLITSFVSRVFYNCLKLDNISFPPNLIEIQSSAFSNSGIKKIELPSSVSIVGENAFFQCLMLEVIDLSKSKVNCLPKSIFFNCKALREIQFANIPYKIADFVFSTTSISVLKLPQITSDSGLFVQKAKLLEIIDMTSSKMTSISGNFFGECSKLATIILPPILNSISNTAFNNCDSIIKIYYCGKKAFWQPDLSYRTMMDIYVSDLYPEQTMFGVKVIKTSKCSEFNAQNA